MGGRSSKVPEPEDTITVKDPESGKVEKVDVQNMKQETRGICCLDRPPEVFLNHGDGQVAMGYKTKRRSRKTRKRRKKQNTRKRPKTLSRKNRKTHVRSKRRRRSRNTTKHRHKGGHGKKIKM